MKNLNNINNLVNIANTSKDNKITSIDKLNKQTFKGVDFNEIKEIKQQIKEIEELEIINEYITSEINEQENNNNNEEIINELKYGYEPLGIRGEDNYIFSNIRQSLVVLASKDFNKLKMINIFGRSYLDENYSIIDNKGNFRGHDLLTLQDNIIMDCIRLGNYSIENVKGYGIFQDPLDKGELIINTEKIWGTSKDFNNSRIRGRNIFNNERDLKINKNQAQATKKDVDTIIDILGTWKFKRGIQDINLQLGWILCAPFAGVLKWRTHESLTGMRGTGKSTLNKFIKNLLGNLSVEFDGASTEPGIRQAMGLSSGAILLDESEADGSKLANILAMLRSASSGIMRAMGTSDQKGQIFELRMAGLLSGIVPPKLNGADSSRFLRIELDPRDTNETGEVKKTHPYLLKESLQEELGRRITMTMIKNYKLFDRIIEDTRLLLLKDGSDSRYADTYGAIIASSFLLTNLVVDISKIEESNKNKVVGNVLQEYSEEMLRNYIKTFNFENEKTQNAFSDEEELLKQILITEISNDELKKENVLQFVLGYHENSAERASIKNLLGRYGIRTEKENNEIFIYIDCDDNKLKSLLRYTRFANGDLKAVLCRINDADIVKKEMSIGNIRRNRTSLIKIRLDSEKFGNNENNEIEF